MSFSDNPTYIDFETPVTAIDFPYVDIGREITKIFNRKEFTLGETIFQSSIIEREATRKGAGAYINHKFMPEISVNENLIPTFTENRDIKILIIFFKLKPTNSLSSRSCFVEP